MSTPFWPAEWAPQAAMLMVWPRRDGDWGNGLDDARNTLQAAINAMQLGSLATCSVLSV